MLTESANSKGLPHKKCLARTTTATQNQICAAVLVLARHIQVHIKFPLSASSNINELLSHYLHNQVIIMTLLLTEMMQNDGI